MITVVTIFSVGHGARALEELIEMLAARDIKELLDIRRHPGSRRHPHFAREALERSLAAVGIEYSWWGSELGGRRRAGPPETSRHPAWRNESFRAFAEHMDGDVFQAALAGLERDAAQRSLAIMCAERLWWNCHRRLVADVLTTHGHRVVHLLDAATSQEHALHEAARVDRQGLVVYDLRPHRTQPLE